ncbi:MAG: metallophosphoesterase [bacterium]|nr:metallophosphoesterase [bacterium]
MSLFAIGDLHLPGGDDKAMDVFGSHWHGHFQRISEDWRSRVGAEDTVLIPGDISWAMQLRDAIPDLMSIGDLPGRKLLIKGNHDYWWSSLTQLRTVLPQGMEVIQHSAVALDQCVVCGTRGWNIPTEETPLGDEDARIFRREVMRLEMALQSAARIASGKPLVVMMHFPPLYDQERDTPFTRLLEAYGVHTVVYGHLHGAGIRIGFQGEQRGVRYCLVSCDSLAFRLAEVSLE